VFQKPNPFPAMSIYDNVARGLKLAGIKKAGKDLVVESSLRRAGLWNEVHRRLSAPGGGLSGGQRQRPCIARALAVTPDVRFAAQADPRAAEPSGRPIGPALGASALAGCGPKFGIRCISRPPEEPRMTQIKMTVDGVSYADEVEPRLLLVHYLRDVLGKTGTPVGCDTSNCGACTVLMDGVSVKSCSVLAVQADGADITTIEGLANGEWHPLQKAFKAEHALQCGYCTPGMILASADLLRDNPHPTDEQIREGLEGNLRRCTGYENIVRAVRRAAQEGAGQ
jgi:aerobic carbon-monoxide dehydrogenase small subunit